MKDMTLSGEMPKRNVIGRLIEVNKKTIVEVISALFILSFLYTAINKTFDIHPTVNAINKSLLISSSELVAWLVVIAEYITALLLFLPATRKAGLYSSLGLMTIF